MEILIERKWKNDTYTVGALYVNGKRFADGKHNCCTLEDKDRGLDQGMDTAKIMFLKKPHVTAIPTGKYKVTVTYSPRFKRMLPLVNDVPGFSGIRIHPGNTAEDTDGCILVGENTSKGRVNNSRHWFDMLYKVISTHLENKDTVTLVIR